MCNSDPKSTRIAYESDGIAEKQPKDHFCSLLRHFITFVTFIRNRGFRPARDGVRVRLFLLSQVLTAWIPLLAGLTLTAKCDSKGVCRRGGDILDKVVILVILDVLARAKQECPPSQLSPPTSVSGLYMAQNYLALPDQCPIPSFTPLPHPGRRPEERRQFWARLPAKRRLPRL